MIIGVCLKNHTYVIGFFTQGLLKLRGTRRGVEKRKCLLQGKERKKERKEGELHTHTNWSKKLFNSGHAQMKKRGTRNN
jgi:hypothetical protein